MPPAGFKLAIPGSERTQTHSLKSEAAGMGPCESCGVQSGTSNSLAPSASVLSCHYHSTNAPHPFIRPSLTLYKLCHWQCAKQHTWQYYVYGSVHRWSTLVIVRDATQSSLFIILQVHSTCFGCQLHPSSGAMDVTVSLHCNMPPAHTLLSTDT